MCWSQRVPRRPQKLVVGLSCRAGSKLRYYSRGLTENSPTMDRKNAADDVVARPKPTQQNTSNTTNATRVRIDLGNDGWRWLGAEVGTES